MRTTNSATSGVGAKIGVLATVLVFAAIAAGVGLSATTNGSMKSTLFHDAAVFCPLSLSGGSPSSSSAVLQYAKTLNQVSTTISLKAAEANTTYYVAIIQGDPSGGCEATAPGSFATNGQGNGSISVSAPATHSQAVAFACSAPIVDCLTLGSNDAYASAVYTHS